MFVRWSPVTSPQHYLRRFVPSLLFVPSLTCSYGGCPRQLCGHVQGTHRYEPQTPPTQTWPLKKHSSINAYFYISSKLIQSSVENGLTLWFPKWRLWGWDVCSFHQPSWSLHIKLYRMVCELCAHLLIEKSCHTLLTFVHFSRALC